MTNEPSVDEFSNLASNSDAVAETNLPTWHKPEMVRMDIGEGTEFDPSLLV